MSHLVLSVTGRKYLIRSHPSKYVPHTPRHPHKGCLGRYESSALTEKRETDGYSSRRSRTSFLRTLNSSLRSSTYCSDTAWNYWSRTSSVQTGGMGRGSQGVLEVTPTLYHSLGGPRLETDGENHPSPWNWSLSSLNDHGISTEWFLQLTSPILVPTISVYQSYIGPRRLREETLGPFLTLKSKEYLFYSNYHYGWSFPTTLIIYPIKFIS